MLLGSQGLFSASVQKRNVNVSDMNVNVHVKYICVGNTKCFFM